MRVTFKRGLLREVCPGDTGSRVRGVGEADDSLLDEPEVSEPEVPELLDVGGPGGPLISVVEIGVVLVIVAVVVDVDAAVSEAVVENDGSTNSIGAPPGSSLPVTYTTAPTSTAMTATPMALAPSKARVELCHGGSAGSSGPNSSSTSRRATGTDIRPPDLRECRVSRVGG